MLEYATPPFAHQAVPPVTSLTNAISTFFLLLFEFLFFSHRKYQETLCTMRSGSMFIQEAPGLDWCLDKCATMEGATYATWNDYDHLCQ